MIQVKVSNLKKLMGQVMAYSKVGAFQTVFLRASGGGGGGMEVVEQPGEKTLPLQIHDCIFGFCIYIY